MQIVHSEITEKIIKSFYEVYNELGHGFLESVYEEAMFLVLCEKSLSVVRQTLFLYGLRGERLVAL